MISAAPLWTSEDTAAELDLLYTRPEELFRDLSLVNKVRKKRYVASQVRPVRNRTL